MTLWTPPVRHPYPEMILTPYGPACNPLSRGLIQAPSSAAGTVSGVVLVPLQIIEPFTVAKAFVCNGATVGTDSWDLGVYAMTNMATGRCDLVRSTGAVLSQGTANAVYDVSAWKVAANSAALTASGDSTDGTTFTTASVTLKAGRLYLLSFTNTAASAAAASSIAGGGAWTSRATTQYNGTAHCVSIWSCVPTADYTGTIVITFGATQTGAAWALNEFSGVDTTTTDGIVQNVVGTGNSTTPLATLGAFGSANNATFGALANTADGSTTPGTGFTELSDPATGITPAQFLQTQWRVDNDTTVDGTITSGQWGACAVEIKADASPFIIPPSMPGNPNIYWAMTTSGTTATYFSTGWTGSSSNYARAGGLLVATVFPLPSVLTPSAGAINRLILAGFSSRTLLG